MIPPMLIKQLPSLKQVGLALGGFALLGMAVALMLARMDARHWEKRFKGEEKARLADQAEWRSAYYQATYNHVLNAERARLAQAAIDERTVDALRSDRNRAASAYDRLREQAHAYLRAASDPDLSSSREATCRAVAGTGCEAIPALLKAAQDNTDQLLRLMAWARAQGEVPSVAPVPENLLPDPAAEARK